MRRVVEKVVFILKGRRGEMNFGRFWCWMVDFDTRRGGFGCKREFETWFCGVVGFEIWVVCGAGLVDFRAIWGRFFGKYFLNF
jgi:hypothetical protein